MIKITPEERIKTCLWDYSLTFENDVGLPMMHGVEDYELRSGKIFKKDFFSYCFPDGVPSDISDTKGVKIRFIAQYKMERAEYDLEFSSFSISFSNLKESTDFYGWVRKVGARRTERKEQKKIERAKKILEDSGYNISNI